MVVNMKSLGAENAFFTQVSFDSAGGDDNFTLKMTHFPDFLWKGIITIVISPVSYTALA